MGIAQVHHKVLALFLRPVAHAVDFQRLGEAVLYALDHVEQQRAGQPVQGAVLLAVGRTGHRDGVVLDRDLHIGVQRLRQSALGSLDRYRVARGKVDCHTGRNRYGFSSNSRHNLIPPTIQRRALRRQCFLFWRACRS